MNRFFFFFPRRLHIALTIRHLVSGFTGEFLLFSASTMAFQFSRLAVSLVVAHWVGPDEFGIWNALNLLLVYGVLLTLGIPNGMNRNVPFLNGQNKRNRAEQVISLSFAFTFLINIVFGLFITGISFNGWIADTYRNALLWMGPLFFSWQMYQFFQMYLKSRIKFRLISIQQFGFALLLLIIVLPMAYFWHIPGFVAGQAIVTLSIVGMIIYISEFQISLKWNVDIFKDLVKVGFPIMAAGLLYSLLTTIDRWVVLQFLGVKELGNYTLAILCLGILSLLPAVISQQMYPRMAFQYGKTQDKHSLQPLIVRQSGLAVAATLPILVIAYIALPWLTSRFLPEYFLGVKPARILLIGLTFIPLAGGVANFLNTVNKQGYYLATQASTLILNLGLDIFLIQKGFGLVGVAMGAAISYAMYTTTLIFIGVLVMKADK